MSDWWNQPGGEAPRGPSCPWCGSPATPEAASCADCGGSLAQREDLAGLAIPGVTAIDPSILRDPKVEAAKYRAHVTRQALRANGLCVPDGGVTDFLGSNFFTGLEDELPPNPEDLGKPSEAATMAAARLAEDERRMALPAAGAPPETTYSGTGWELPVAGDPTDWWNQPGGGAAEADDTVACPWCATRCAPDAATCGGCGAGLVGKEALDTLEIPGVTTVDPALQQLDAAGRKKSSSILGVMGRMGTTGMIIGAVSNMTSARASKPERQAVDLNGPNPVIVALAEQMRARGPIDAGTGDPADTETGVPAAPESDPWRDLPRQAEDQDR